MLGGPVAELDTVKAAQVGAGLGRGDDVVDRDGQLGTRQGDWHQRGAELLVLCQRRIHRRAHVWRQALAKKFLRYANAQPGDRIWQRAAEVFGWHLQRG